MLKCLQLFLVVLSAFVVAKPIAAEPPSTNAAPSSRAIAFYYGWYGNPETDGAYNNWNHPVLDDSGHRFPGGKDIGANFYPEAGPYSTKDPDTLTRQMRELRQARVGVISVSWWGADHFTDQRILPIMNAAQAHGLKVNFHIEPFGGRNAVTTRTAIAYIIHKYGSHPAFHRGSEFGGKPVFFLYDSYLTPAEEWATILKPGTPDTIRGTEYDAAIIGLWVKEKDGDDLVKGHFDGYYTYFAAEGFTWGSTMKNWPAIAKFAEKHSKIFIPCVGPGYNDTRIRPFNRRTTRHRQQGAYYKAMFKAAARSSEIIAITSYNEWHEGTQIEPAIPMKAGDYQYEDYTPLAPDAYLRLTSELITEHLEK